MADSQSTRKQSTPEERAAMAKARNRRYYESHRDKIDADVTAYRKANPEKVSAWNKKRDKEKSKAASAKWRKANPEKVKLASAEWRKANKEKADSSNRAWKKANPESVSATWRKKKYGVSKAEFASMLVACGGKCECCKTPFSAITGEKPHLDHCHKTQTVRGILCSRCNFMIGNARDNSSILRSGARYLDRAKQSNET